MNLSIAVSNRATASRTLAGSDSCACTRMPDSFAHTRKPTAPPTHPAPRLPNPAPPLTDIYFLIHTFARHACHTFRLPLSFSFRATPYSAAMNHNKTIPILKKGIDQAPSITNAENFGTTNDSDGVTQELCVFILEAETTNSTVSEHL